ncbi:VOC family protein [Sanguibacter suaedae]|uniref:VOC family protein n=1 Tax=Sanguibacter suaedae TaxID=2795737 RepID=A0A934I464_9MICO|nr:VOC family protein [Sanguibacter suaedae]MBI9115264.1 VOC family protein [Sanguibacter suaedae]
MAITEIQTFSVPVSDQDRSRDFYRDVLGFQVLGDQQFTPEMRWVQLAPPSGTTSISLVTWFPTMSPGDLKGIVVETDDLEGDVARLTDAGVAFTSSIEEQPWGRFATFDDPDGNGIVLQHTTNRVLI